jgi:transposase-like protein
VVKNSKLFRMLKEKIETNDAVFVKEMNELNEVIA